MLQAWALRPTGGLCAGPTSSFAPHPAVGEGTLGSLSWAGLRGNLVAAGSVLKTELSQGTSLLALGWEAGLSSRPAGADLS